jgi:hypothetical protein
MSIYSVFGPRKDEVRGEWWKLHYEKVNYFYSTFNIFRLIKSIEMRWVGHVARMGKGFFGGKT